MSTSKHLAVSPPPASTSSAPATMKIAVLSILLSATLGHPNDYQQQVDPRDQAHQPDTALPPRWGQTHPLPPEPPRGGSTMITSPFSCEDDEDSSLVPRRRKRIDTESIALALRYTCELNHRLYHGTALCSMFEDGKRQHLHMDLIDDDHDYGTDAAITSATSAQPQLQHQGMPLTGGALTEQHPQHEYPGHPVHTHPSRPWQAPIRRGPTTPPKTELTLFHRRSPRFTVKKKRGAQRWGPDLKTYLASLATALECSFEPRILALALIYLDRACSVQTPRSTSADPYQGGGVSYYPPCPYVSPRTVHRLILTAMVLASKAVRGGSTHQYAQQLEQFGVDEQSLLQLEGSMIGALGVQGLSVEEAQVERWLEKWGNTFFPHSTQEEVDGGNRKTSTTTRTTVTVERRLTIRRVVPQPEQQQQQQQPQQPMWDAPPGVGQPPRGGGWDETAQVEQHRVQQQQHEAWVQPPPPKEPHP